MGRVFGAFEAVIVGSLLLRALLTGPLIELAGPRIPTVAIAGIALITLIVCAPHLRSADGPASLEEPAAAPAGALG